MGPNSSDEKRTGGGPFSLPFDLFPDTPGNAPQGAQPLQNPPPFAPPQAAPFKLHQMIDRQHNGVVVCAFQYPAVWEARSEVVWNYQNASLPVTARGMAYDPKSASIVEFFPVESFFWVEPHYGLAQPGQSALGQTCMPPMPGMDALMKWVLPKYRGNRQGLRVVGGGPVPNLAQRLGPGSGSIVGEDVCVRIEYSENGRMIEEEIYGTKTLQNVPYYGPMGMMTQTNWGFMRLFSFRAEKGQLDAQRDLFWKIASSVQMNPLWEQLAAQVFQQIKAQFDQYIQMGYSQIQAAGNISRTISANNDAMLRSFEHQRVAAASHHSPGPSGGGRSPSDNFSDYIRGVDTVNDPYYGESQQDNSYKYHWTDGYGNYQQSNDVFFNPNIGSTQSWTLMEPK